MATQPGSIHGFHAPLLEGGEFCLGELKGKVVLIVNTASKCGFTPQYEGLEQLYRTYREQGFVVLGFPCDQFGHQEPGTGEEIAHFCATRFNVTFPMFAKIQVNGPDAHPLYQFLKQRKRGLFWSGRIKWNFTKFLVDRAGFVVARHAPGKKPMALAAEIEQLLKAG